MAAKQNKSAKGNPAHTRMANKHRQERRAANRVEQEKRKVTRNANNRFRATVNRAAHDIGYLSPWQTAKWNRYQSEDRTEKRVRYLRKQAASE